MPANGRAADALDYLDRPEPELYGDEHEPIEDDTDQIDGEHPDGDYPPEIYDDDPDEPIEDEPAVEDGAD